MGGISLLKMRVYGIISIEFFPYCFPCAIYVLVTVGRGFPVLFPFWKGGIDMSMIEPSFWKYLIFDVDNPVYGIAGIREEAPEEEKQAYQEYIKEEKELKKKGIKR